MDNFSENTDIYEALLEIIKTVAEKQGISVERFILNFLEYTYNQ